MQKFLNFIDGEHQCADGNTFAPVIEPATGKQYAEVSLSGISDVQKAVAAAQRAQPAWAALPNTERARWLRKIAAGITARVEEFAQAESKDCGKPIRNARDIDLQRAITNFDHFASQADCFHGQSYEQTGVGLHYTLRQPLGVVACISPWNLPLYLLSWKIAPALATGNCVIAKPSEVTPATASLLTELCRDIGLPRGVLNVLHGVGSSIGPSLCTHQAIKAVSFTGSTQTGRSIAQTSAEHFKKISLEMGGKNATIVFADAEIDAAVRTSVRAAFANQGQVCLCGSRVLIERSIYQRFCQAFVAEATKLLPADPALETTQFGALVSSAHLHKVEAAVALAHEEGGRLLLGGERITLPGRCEAGYFFPPTIFDQLPNDCTTNQEEIFGPVVTLTPFDDEQHALLLANQSRYGLACSVHTQNVGRAQRMAAGLQTGLVWINSWMQRDVRVPFGGVKQSGVGREGGIDAMHFFTEAKSVFLAN